MISVILIYMLFCDVYILNFVYVRTISYRLLPFLTGIEGHDYLIIIIINNLIN